jgi:site-specific DNA-methyltransferase (adenine-specific)
VSSRLIHGDCLEAMAAMEAGSVDAVVTDPPYGLAFMGKHWDHGLPGVDFWTEALRVLRPSHYLLAFGGTRTWHRLACALEDAGFEIRDTLMWLYGSGFPKGTACLKPAWEPIILARKPGPKRALGIEECRVSTTDDLNGGAYAQNGNRVDLPGAERSVAAAGMWAAGKTVGADFVQPSGRYPANLILDEEAGAMLGDKARFFFCAKASRAEREAGLFMQHERFAPTMGNGIGGREHDPLTATPRGNHHPTVKPLALMRWLVKLVAYPGDTVLDPFLGSGTTGVACAEEGREFIGIEREAEYVEIARARIGAAEAQTRLCV